MSAAPSRSDTQPTFGFDVSCAALDHFDARTTAEIAARFGHYQLDVATWTISWSVGVASIFGRPLPKSGLINVDEHLACYHPDDAATARIALLSAMAGGYDDRPYRVQRRVIRPDGTLRHVLAQGIGRRDSYGRMTTTFGILLDVTEAVEAEYAAREITEVLRATFETMDQGIVMVGADQRIRVMNGKAKDLLGLPTHLARSGIPFAEILRNQEASGEFAHVSEADLLCLPIWSNEASIRPFTRRRPNGTVLEIRTASMADGGFVRTYTDVSDRHAYEAERKKVEEALRRSEKRLAMALESGGDGVWDYDVRESQISVTGRWWAILGYEEHEVGSKLADWLDRTHPGDAERVVATLREHLTEGMPPVELEYRMRGKSGAYVWTLLRGRVVEREADGSAARMVGTHMDITRRKEAELALARAAQHDVLTGLPNRALFHERLQERISEAERHGDGFAVLACDLDRFKAVNDTHGHAAGDELMREMAKRLTSVIRTEDLVARLGGDEFSIVLGRVADQADAYVAAQRVIEIVEQPLMIGGQEIQIGVSIGIAFGCGDGRSVDELCRRADTAMYVAKTSGRNTYRAYHASLDAVLVGRAKLQDDLQDAVRRGGFLLCYQPSFTLRTGEVSSFEALLRWNHPTRGPISPVEFIPMAEQTGLMVRLGEWTLRESCREAATWPGMPRIAVNISGTQFRQPGLEQCVVSALATSGLNPDRLILEVTEDVLIQDADTVFASLTRLHRLGVRIALDRFGTGHSGLNHLRRFPFTAIKLHQSLVRDLGQTEAAAMARAIVGLCAAPGVEVVAEGVETHEELNLVRGVGCTAVQGFLFSKPLLAEDAARLINRPKLGMCA